MPKRKSPERKGALKKNNMPAILIAIAASVIVAGGALLFKNSNTDKKERPSVKQIEDDWRQYMLQSCNDPLILNKFDSVLIANKPEEGGIVTDETIKCLSDDGYVITEMPTVVRIDEINQSNMNFDLAQDPWNEVSSIHIVNATVSRYAPDQMTATVMAYKEGVATNMANAYIVDQMPDLCANIKDPNTCGELVATVSDGLAALVATAKYPRFLETAVHPTSAVTVSPLTDSRCFIAEQVEKVVEESGSTRAFPPGILPTEALGCKGHTTILTPVNDDLVAINIPEDYTKLTNSQMKALRREQNSNNDVAVDAFNQWGI
jgi:hypothetical protein